MLASQKGKMPIDELSKSIADGARKNTAITNYRDEIPLINQEVFGKQDIINPLSNQRQEEAYRRSQVGEVNQAIQRSNVRSVPGTNIPWWVVFVILIIIVGSGLWMIWRFGTSMMMPMMPPPGLPGMGGTSIVSRTNSMIDPINNVPQVTTQTANVVPPTSSVIPPITPPVTTPMDNQLLNSAVNPMINPMTTNVNLPSAVPTTIIQNKQISPTRQVTQRIQTPATSPLQPPLHMPTTHHLHHISSSIESQPIQQNLKCRFSKFNHNKKTHLHQQKQYFSNQNCDETRSKHLCQRIRD